MRGVYEANISIDAIDSGRTLLYLTAPSTKAVEILSAAVTNSSGTTNQQLECVLQAISSLGTPTKTDVTPSKREAGDQSAASTVAGNVTASEPTYGAQEAGREGFPHMGGYRFQPTPEERPVITPNTSWGLRLITPSPTPFNARASLVFREIG